MLNLKDVASIATFCLVKRAQCKEITKNQNQLRLETAAVLLVFFYYFPLRDLIE